LEQDKSASSIDAIFRAAHSIKADAATMGFVKIADLAHQAEDVLHLVRSGRIDLSRILIDALLQVFDCLRRMISRPLEAEDKDASESLMLLERFLATEQDAESRESTNVACMENSAKSVRPAGGPEPGLQLVQLTIPASKLDILVDQLMLWPKNWNAI
jgi:two-component system chemotaxis sensor kinase CheA